MTIEQKTIELQSVSPPLTRDQIIAELGRWQAEQSIADNKNLLQKDSNVVPVNIVKQEPVEEEIGCNNYTGQCIRGRRYGITIGRWFIGITRA
jgi:hypothetical protein